ncbi:MAG: sigma-70 family RNA polymerase sigma factor [Planctomycetaceae bacterium]|nr:sigma-70 family RNA polymerase sigma factor [Planctomycetaceae bacterium]
MSNLSPDEFVKLTLEHEGRFFSVVLAMLPGCADAEDIIQEAITVMWQKSEQFQRGTDFGAWGCRIVRLKVMEHLRKRRGVGVLLSHEALEMVALDLEKPAGDLAARTAALKDCLTKLEPTSRELITIRFHPKMTLKKTAEQLGRSEPTIRKSVRKILRQLERCVERTLGIDAETVHE